MRILPTVYVCINSTSTSFTGDYTIPSVTAGSLYTITADSIFGYTAQLEIYVCMYFMPAGRFLRFPFQMRKNYTRDLHCCAFR